MSRVFAAGVFLTISTYDGPQLVYHYFDSEYAESLDHHETAENEGAFKWSDDEFSDDEKQNRPSSPSSSRNSSHSSRLPVSIAIEPRYNSQTNYDPLVPIVGSQVSRNSRASRFSTNQPTKVSGSLNSSRTGPSSQLSQGLKGLTMSNHSLDTSTNSVGNISINVESRPGAYNGAEKIKNSNASVRSRSQPATAKNIPKISSAVDLRAAPDIAGSLVINKPETVLQKSGSQAVLTRKRSNTVNAATVAMHFAEATTESSSCLAPLTTVIPPLQPQSSATPSANSSAAPSAANSRSPTPQVGSPISSVTAVKPTTTPSKPRSTHQSGSVKSSLPAGLDREVLAEALSPPEAMCNERFSLTLDNCTFIGIPVHILESGTWRPLKKSFAETAEQKSTARSEILEEKPPRESNQRLEAIADSGPTDLRGDHQNRNRVPNIVTDKSSPMRMFHVSFAILPPINQAADCENRLYRSIVVPFMRILRQEQASKNYVWEQASLIMKTQESCAHMSPGERQQKVESVCELASTLRKIYNALCRTEIARVMIANKPRAFQIPLQLEAMNLPPWYTEPGVHTYVNTSNNPDKEITHEVYTCYGLLLLDDPEVIVDEIDVDPQGPVAAMIRSIDPTSSLEGLSRQNDIEIDQIVNLVWSLVYWRRARIIIPLHARHTYGISPLAPTGTRFQSLSKSFHSIFPMMPPIQKLLGMLSNGKLKPFAAHIPTSDHRHIYMQSLAWLLQNDFIVHLPTFALILIPRKIKLSAHNFEHAISAIDDDEDEEGTQGVSGEFVRPISTHISRPNSRSISYRLDPEDIHDSFIADPRVASSIEKRWMSHVMVSGATRNPEHAALFQRLTKYFNGKDCLEQVMIHEKISRENMRAFLLEYSQYVVTFKHW